jgi:LmbE family N-acetylglucosaminyl deacetylase
MAEKLLFVLAHQDDELAFATRILHETRLGHIVHCAYLTNGAALGQDSARREKESRGALTSLGVEKENIHFIGSQESLADLKLVFNLRPALEALTKRLAGIRFDRLFCMAFEGGHPDHDASHLVALAFAKDQGLMGKTWERSFYNGEGTIGPILKLFSPLRETAEAQLRKVEWRDAVRVFLLLKRYPSQYKAWIILTPPFFIKTVIKRSELFQKSEIRDVLSERPHSGKLLYERFISLKFEQFAEAAREFCDQLDKI